MPNPTAIALIPKSVSLRPQGEQMFVAIKTAQSAGASALIAASSITWNLSPSVGTIDDTGKYRAPDEVDEAIAVKVTAIDPGSGNCGLHHFIDVAGMARLRSNMAGHLCSSRVFRSVLADLGLATGILES